MENETFRTRVLNLISRSRKALRLYSNAGRNNTGHNYASAQYTSSPSSSGSRVNDTSREYTELQTKPWRDITSDLLNDLSLAMQKDFSVKMLCAEIYNVRDKYNSLWRSLEAELHVKQKELIRVSEAGDFIKAATLSTNLILIRSRFQASQAAYHELEELIKKSRLSSQPIELSSQDVVEERQVSLITELPETSAKVIPLRKIL